MWKKWLLSRVEMEDIWNTIPMWAKLGAIPLGILVGLGLMKIKKDYEQLEKQSKKLIVDFEDYKKKNKKNKMKETKDYEQLEKQSKKLTDDFEDFKKKYDKMKTDYETLEKQNKKLTDDLEDFKKRNGKTINKMSDVQNKCLDKEKENYQDIKDIRKDIQAIQMDIYCLTSLGKVLFPVNQLTIKDDAEPEKAETNHI